MTWNGWRGSTRSGTMTNEQKNGKGEKGRYDVIQRERSPLASYLLHLGKRTAGRLAVRARELLSDASERVNESCESATRVQGLSRLGVQEARRSRSPGKSTAGAKVSVYLCSYPAPCKRFRAQRSCAIVARVSETFLPTGCTGTVVCPNLTWGCCGYGPGHREARDI